MESKRIDWDVFRVDNLPTVSKNNQLDSSERVMQMLTIKSDAARVELFKKNIYQSVPSERSSLVHFDTHTEESRQV